MQDKSFSLRGSTRIDFLGGTLDIYPINLVLDPAPTLSAAINIDVGVTLTPLLEKKVEFHFEDYDFHKSWELGDWNQASLFKGPEAFIEWVLKTHGELRDGLLINCKANIRPGSGLGTSSTLGIVFDKACTEFFKKDFDLKVSVEKLMKIESKILDKGPAGYQDYFPAMTGGVVALKTDFSGIRWEQIYQEDTVKKIEKNLWLIDSGETRSSGASNWEVYKKFFDHDEGVRNALARIGEITAEGILAFKSGRWERFIDLIHEEGALREKLFDGILTPNMKKFFQEADKEGLSLGHKVCGAGGGGHFILLKAEKNKDRVMSLLSKYGMKRVDFCFSPPLS